MCTCSSTGACLDLVCFPCNVLVRLQVASAAVGRTQVVVVGVVVMGGQWACDVCSVPAVVIVRKQEHS